MSDAGSPQQFNSLTALKMAALAESNVTYEQLEDLEREFEDAETDISMFPLLPLYQDFPARSSRHPTIGIPPPPSHPC
jgi:tetrahydromethanopterin S-methyltransferase subunit B